MHAKTAQERTGMLSGSMTKGCIRVGATPRENGRAIDDQIASTNKSTTRRREHAEDKECLRQWCPGPLSAFALLRRTGNTRTTILA